ncbi:hypothetical protein KIN20_027402 [Parelaphostrongylus tenuis]|uniref:Uncharacterized protein n=1 Tax=Parelaphostrongylus tenuis TaxID=148309 RepID=A0AAD5WE28_PARTN|nr:hypothetical protein KIN20_027402 [Parelaphostrongylus tenuis]
MLPIRFPNPLTTPVRPHPDRCQRVEGLLIGAYSPFHGNKVRYPIRFSANGVVRSQALIINTSSAKHSLINF